MKTRTGEKVLELDLDKLRLDGGTQPRAELDAEWVAHLREIAEHENEPGAPHLPELVAFHDGSSYWLAEGFHRYFAKKKAGHKKAATIVHTGTLQDAILFAAGTNAAHGKPRTHADIRHAIRMLLANPEWRGWSNSELARRVRIASHHVVADEKRKLQEEEERARKAERDAERKRQQEEKAKADAKKGGKPAASNGVAGKIAGSSPAIPTSEKASQMDENPSDSKMTAPNRTVTYRTKHGTVSTMNTANIGGVRVKLIEVETEREQLANLDKQIPRSLKKYVVQCLKRGLLEDEIVAKVREEIKKNPVKR